MTSKEALERLYSLVCKFSPFLPFNLYEPIKQDLDRLEQLEKENKELHNQIISLELDTCIPDLRKENQKLRKAVKGLNEYFDFEIDEETETLYCCLGDVTGIDIVFLRELKEVLDCE